MSWLVTCLVILSISNWSLQQEEVKSIENAINILFPKKPETKSPQTTTLPVNQTTPTPSAEKCECVSYYLCDNSSRINGYGEGLINLKAGDDDECSIYLDVCCMPPKILKNPIMPTTIVQKPTGCGRRNSNGVAIITTGDTSNEAKFGEFPWMVAILQDEPMPDPAEPLTKFLCGGSLIHPQAVVTSAHCVDPNAKNIKVRAGEWDTQTEKEIFPYQDRVVKNIIIHPLYYAGTLFNDVAILILESPFKPSPHIDVVCLPPQGAVIPNGTRCFASGWGKDVFGKKGQYQVILKKLDLPIVDTETCQRNLRETRLGAHFMVHESFICAGGEEGLDTCRGDGGGPLVCPVPGQINRYQQAGIVAWGIGCGEFQVPGAYANVALFRDWINQQMVLNNLPTTTYEY